MAIIPQNANIPQIANLAQLARDAKSNQLKDMLLYLFEKENELDFTLSRQISQIVGQYTDRVGYRLDVIAELEKMQGSILSFETVKLLRDVNDDDLSKVRLNKEFVESFESPSTSSGSACSVLDTEEDAVEEYLLEEQFRMKLEAEEILLFKEEQKLEEESRLRLEEEAKMMREEEKMFEEETINKKEYKKRELAIMNSDHMKQAMARVVPSKRSHCSGVTSSSWLKVYNKLKHKPVGRCVINQDMTEYLKYVKPWFEVFIPLNEPGEHWNLATFDIYSGLVTFYDNGDTRH
ncbi:hypothetical protein Tco_0514380 [Tanacetum coccineum]